MRSHSSDTRPCAARRLTADDGHVNHARRVADRPASIHANVAGHVVQLEAASTGRPRGTRRGARATARGRRRRPIPRRRGGRGPCAASAPARLPARCSGSCAAPGEAPPASAARAASRESALGWPAAGRRRSTRPRTRPPAASSGRTAPFLAEEAEHRLHGRQADRARGAVRPAQPALVELEPRGQHVRNALVKAGDEDPADSRFRHFLLRLEPKWTRQFSQVAGRAGSAAQDKSALRVGPATILERQLAALDGLVDRVFVVAGRPATASGVRSRAVVPDRLPNAGALGGIYTALCEAAGSHVLVVACDLPFLTAPLLAQTDRAWPTTTRDAVVPRIDRRPAAALRRLRAAPRGRGPPPHRVGPPEDPGPARDDSGPRSRPGRDRDVRPGRAAVLQRQHAGRPRRRPSGFRQHAGSARRPLTATIMARGRPRQTSDDTRAMILPLHALVRERITSALGARFGLAADALPPIVIDYPPTRELGDLALPARLRAGADAAEGAEGDRRGAGRRARRHPGRRPGRGDEGLPQPVPRPAGVPAAIGSPRGAAGRRAAPAGRRRQDDRRAHRHQPEQGGPHRPPPQLGARRHAGAGPPLPRRAGRGPELHRRHRRAGRRRRRRVPPPRAAGPGRRPRDRRCAPGSTSTAGISTPRVAEWYEEDSRACRPGSTRSTTSSTAATSRPRSRRSSPTASSAATWRRWRG